jgi:RAB protein geranylgeranyltransferase component A
LQVLHMDRNSYYGGDSASLNLSQVRSALQDWHAGCLKHSNS